ncbi:MAG: DUF87 domain-containing protein [Saprospiraceae bacterium]|nr:DUF87 domain-containing protein [Saprospiraceae bacterium]
MATFNELLNTTVTQGNPIEVLKTFLQREEQNEKARLIDQMRFVGYVLELGYETAKIITSDPYKLAVGGIPRGSFLIMTPVNAGKTPPHFTLLRVTGVSPTPLSNQVQQTYFELHKKSMPELDIWTQSELQWGALDCDVLGMFYADPKDMKKLAFSGDVNNVVSAHRYKVFAPDEALLKLIVNGTVKSESQFEIGNLRTMECGLTSDNGMATIPIKISMQDFKGCRTAMFGKTRLGKSNIVKLIARGMLDATLLDNSVGQIIFDINGEYANDNPQDGNKSIRSAYQDRCHVYALTPRSETPSSPLRFNFYEQPAEAINVISSFLNSERNLAQYVRSFMEVALPTREEFDDLPNNEKMRALRRIQIFWAILHKAGFTADENAIRSANWVAGRSRDFNPGFSENFRQAIYDGAAPSSAPKNLGELVVELEKAQAFRKATPTSPLLTSGSGNALFEPDAVALLDFFNPGTTGGGVRVIRPYLQFHDAKAADFVNEVLGLLDKGKTVILDLGNATDEIRRYFSDYLSKAIFGHQERKFVNNKLGKTFVQLYFEEAHNLFPPDGKDLTGVYARFAKEGAKFHIGMVYSTQSPSTINKELLAQTENFFVGHLSSQDETRALSRVQIAYAGIEDDILRARTPGYMRMLTQSHRFVIPVQAHKFEAIIK